MNKDIAVFYEEDACIFRLYIKKQTHGVQRTDIVVDLPLSAQGKYCHACKWWQRRKSGTMDEFGMCDGLVPDNPGKIMLFSDGQRPLVLLTRENFGCVNWEQNHAPTIS